MIFKFCCNYGDVIDDFSIFAVIRYQDKEGVFIDIYCKKGKCKMTSVYMPYNEFNHYYDFGLWVFD